MGWEVFVDAVLDQLAFSILFLLLIVSHRSRFSFPRT